MESMPDQGIMKSTDLKTTPVPPAHPAPRATAPADSSSAGGTLCRVCNKPRKDHPGRLFCKDKAKAKKGGGGKGSPKAKAQVQNVAAKKNN